MFQIREVATGKLLVNVKAGGRVRSANYDPIRQILSSIRADYGPGGQENRSLVIAAAAGSWSPATRPFTRINLVQDLSGTYLILPSPIGGSQMLPTALLDGAFSWPFAITVFALDRGRKWAAVCTAQDLQVVSVPAGHLASRLPWTSGAGSLAVDARSKRAVWLGADQLVVWDYGTGRQKSYKFYTAASGPVAISAGGKYLFYGTQHGGVVLFDLDAGKPVFFSGSREMGSMYATFGVDISDDGRELAAGFWTGELKVWRTEQSLSRF